MGLSVPVGRLLAVDSRASGELGHSLVALVYLVGPLTPAEAASITHPDGEVIEAR
ncbi:hypothetical protein ACN20G_00820 [Streptomyces sp. BI20]|uniref:hypothetical protein n=1 Tax=Streptomyces sp. BI20 TaxID=3403460 RepID=UPI003C790420